MFDKVLTLFNYHEGTALWYPSVIEGADFIDTSANSNSTTGDQNADTVEILIQAGNDKSIKTTEGIKKYLTPKEYIACNNPAGHITFTPQRDFVFSGEWPETELISDEEDFDSGFYQRANAEHDGVYRINSVAFYSLIPHFEIGGH